MYSMAVSHVTDDTKVLVDLVLLRSVHDDVEVLERLSWGMQIASKSILMECANAARMQECNECKSAMNARVQ